MNTLLTVIASASVSTALCATLVWLMRTWIGERLKSSIQHEYNQNLALLNAELKSQGDRVAAQLKGEIDREADKIKLVFQVSSEFQKASFSKRLDAVEKIWGAVLQLHDAIPAAIHHLDILLDDEYISARKNKNFDRALGELDHAPIVVGVYDRSRELEKLRPYTGEYLWNLFQTYQANLIRIIYLVDISKKETIKILWYKDNLIRQQIQAALGPETLKEFDSTQFSKTSWIRSRFTHAILLAIDNIMAGKTYGDATMRQVESMEEQLRASKREALS